MFYKMDVIELQNSQESTSGGVSIVSIVSIVIIVACYEEHPWTSASAKIADTSILTLCRATYFLMELGRGMWEEGMLSQVCYRFWHWNI